MPELTWENALVMSGLGLAAFAVSLFLVGVLIVRMDADYFAGRKRPAPATPLRWARRILKNALGWLLIAAGIVMAIPFVPGQGLLTIAIGLSLVEFPGKWRLERAIVFRPRVLSAINRLRARFGRSPLVTPPEETSPGG
jgi:hypothetical protein